MFKKLNLLLAGALVSASAFAAYGPAPAAPVGSAANWTLGVGYGQMFSMKKTTTGTNVAKIDNPSIFEVDFFHNNGFGAVYMTNAKKKALIEGTAAVSTSEYSFNGYFLGYQRHLASNMTGRVLVGLSDQKYVTTTPAATVKTDGKFAFGVSGTYHVDLSGKLNGFAELGYLDQKKFTYATGKDVKASGFYWKLGVCMPI